MPLNILNFEERGQVSVLNMWADQIEQSLNAHTNQIGGTNFRSANALTTAQIAGTNVSALNVVPLTTIAATHKVDSTQPYFSAKGGAIIPQIVGSGTAIFTYASTTTTASITWSMFSLLYADGTTASVAGGSQGVTGLTANTTYYLYPFVTSGLVVNFATVSGGVGTPAILYTPQSPTATQVQTGQTVTAANNGGVQVVTPVSGSGGGSGGGTQLCIHSTMLVEVKDLGLKPIGTCQIGDWIRGRYDWTQIQNIRLVNQTHFIRFETDYGCVEVTPTHCITTGQEESKPASSVNLSDYLIRKDGYANIKCIRLVHIPDAQKVILHCEPEHVFWAGEHKPELLVHNFVPNS